MTERETIVEIEVPVPGAAYSVNVGRDLSSQITRFCSELADAEKAFVITQRSVAEHASKIAAGLEEAGLESHTVYLKEGEEAKSLDSVRSLYEELARLNAHRRDVVVALGGGVVTDVAGFVASTFNRGMSLVNIPTTLLGQVDAAIGGKTGINLDAAKNLVGTIYQPRAVFCDVELLSSLPSKEFASGLAEVIKYGFIREPGLLGDVADKAAELLAADAQATADIVARSVSIKAAIVSEDEQEDGVRMHLNYGHTFAHAIERTSGYGQIRHGEAVSLGMVAAALLAENMSLVSRRVVDLHRSVLARVGLPVRATLNFDDLSAAWLHDKKYRGGVRFVLLAETPDGSVSPRADVDAPQELIARAIERLTE